MLKATCHLKSQSPIQFGKFYQVEKEDNENHDQFEKRTWRERAHYDPKTGEAFIPPMMFKKALESAGAFLGMKIPGKGQKTYTKHFLGGVMITEKVMLGVGREASNGRPQIEGEWHHVPSDGKKGGSTRVMRCFPTVNEWEGILEVVILSDEITPEVFKKHLNTAGMFIGIGVFRPASGGYYGRFEVADIQFEKMS